MANDYHYDKLVILNQVYQNTLASDKKYSPPASIVTPLYPHQQTLVQGMHQYKEKMLRGFIAGQQAVNGKIGIIGDPPGTGKTLSMLAYLASYGHLYPSMTSELTPHSTRYFFSHDFHRLSEQSFSNLIIVPHSLFGQWKQEIEKHTTLSYVPIETKRMLKPELIETIRTSSFILTTNKCYKFVQDYARDHQLQWNHIVIDEASSIYLHASDPLLRFQFLWMMTSHWIPLLFKNPTIIKSTLFHLRDRVQIHPDLETWLLDHITSHYEGTLASASFLKEYLCFFHENRGHLVLRNSTSHLESSIQLPDIVQNYLPCRPNLSLPSLTSYYLARNKEPHIRSRNIPYLFQALGMEFTLGNNYQERAITAKKPLIARMIQDNECVICLESCEYPTIVNCCYHMYCGKCLLTTTLFNCKCPTCREPLQISNMCCLSSLSPQETLLAKNKTEVCLDLFRDHPNGKFIVYSSFDNIYYQLFDEIDRLGLKAERIESNLFSLLKTVRNFQQGKTNILFISNIDLIRGLSLTKTSHLIFYHELPVYEQKQTLLHSSQRLGRTQPLTVLYLNSEIQV